MSDQHANVSTDLTAVADAWARVRLDAAERDADTVGYVLAQYRAQAGVTEQELATWLGIDEEEIRPPLDGQDLGLDQPAEVYGADRARLLEAFEQGDR